jgi:hypothetical protein
MRMLLFLGVACVMLTAPLIAEAQGVNDGGASLGETSGSVSVSGDGSAAVQTGEGPSADSSGGATGTGGGSTSGVSGSAGGGGGSTGGLASPSGGGGGGHGSAPEPLSLGLTALGLFGAAALRGLVKK